MEGLDICFVSQIFEEHGYMVYIEKYSYIKKYNNCTLYICTSLIPSGYNAKKNVPQMFPML